MGTSNCQKQVKPMSNLEQYHEKEFTLYQPNGHKSQGSCFLRRIDKLQGPNCSPMVQFKKTLQMLWNWKQSLRSWNLKLPSLSFNCTVLSTKFGILVLQDRGRDGLNFELHPNISL